MEIVHLHLVDATIHIVMQINVPLSIYGYKFESFTLLLVLVVSGNTKFQPHSLLILLVAHI